MTLKYELKLRIIIGWKIKILLDNGFSGLIYILEVLDYNKKIKKIYKNTCNLWYVVLKSELGGEKW